jgi:hypothetical protein
MGLSMPLMLSSVMAGVLADRFGYLAFEIFRL